MRLFLLLLATLFTTHAAAADEARHDPIEFTAADFERQRDALAKEIRTTDRYAEITPRQMDDVRHALDRMEELFARHGSVEAMPTHDKVALFNAQEVINTTLTAAAADSRLVCKRETPTGSHRQRVVCQTVATRERIRQESTAALRPYQRGCYAGRGEGAVGCAPGRSEPPGG